MFASARKAAQAVFDPAFRGVVLKSLLLTLVLFALLFTGVQYALAHLPQFHWYWIDVAVGWIASVLTIAGLLFLGAPVAALFASLFLDEIAGAVEKSYYPADPPASGVPFLTGLLSGLRLTLWVIVLNLALLVVLPGLGVAAVVAVNGWLLGREFFELAALRHMSYGAAKALRRRHAFGVWAAGLVLAALAMVPAVNLFAPLFGAAFMVHVYKHYQHEEHPIR